MKTSQGLVRHAECALREGWGYVWGTFGQVLSEALLDSKKAQYPSEIGGYYTFIKQHYLNRRSADCVGLIKSYYWWDEGADNPAYSAATDLSADGMAAKAVKKGATATMPEVPGLCVYKRGHIGIYLGGGWVIEAKGTKYGVVKSKLKDGGWTLWLECPFITYSHGREEWKAAIQERCRFDKPEDVWKAIETHPHPDAVYEKLAAALAK